jgi:hypothetical protein
MWNSEKGFGSRGVHWTRGGHSAFHFVGKLREMVPHKYRSGEREREIERESDQAGRTLSTTAHICHIRFQTTPVFCNGSLSASC